MDIRVQGVMQLRSGRRYQDPAKDRPPTPTSLCRWRRAQTCPKCALSPNSAVCECRWSRSWHQKVHYNANAASASATRSETAVTHLDASREGSHLSGDCPARPVQPQCCICGAKHTANYRGCVKWKEARAAYAKQANAQLRRPKSLGQPKAPKAKPAEPSAQQKDLGEGWNHVVRGG